MLFGGCAGPASPNQKIRQFKIFLDPRELVVVSLSFLSYVLLFFVHHCRAQTYDRSAALIALLCLDEFLRQQLAGAVR